MVSTPKRPSVWQSKRDKNIKFVSNSKFQKYQLNISKVQTQLQSAKVVQTQSFKSAKVVATQDFTSANVSIETFKTTKLLVFVLLVI